MYVSAVLLSGLAMMLFYFLADFYLLAGGELILIVLRGEG
jgi:hypothetical protein